MDIGIRVRNAWIRNIIISIIFISVLVYFLRTTGHRIAEDLRTDKVKMEYYVGESIIIDGDTSMIISYELLQETFKLNNGKTVSLILVEKQLGEYEEDRY